MIPPFPTHACPALEFNVPRAFVTA